MLMSSNDHLGHKEIRQGIANDGHLVRLIAKNESVSRHERECPRTKNRFTTCDLLEETRRYDEMHSLVTRVNALIQSGCTAGEHLYEQSTLCTRPHEERTHEQIDIVCSNNMSRGDCFSDEKSSSQLPIVNIISIATEIRKSSKCSLLSLANGVHKALVDCSLFYPTISIVRHSS